MCSLMASWIHRNLHYVLGRSNNTCTVGARSAADTQHTAIGGEFFKGHLLLLLPLRIKLQRRESPSVYICMCVSLWMSFAISRTAHSIHPTLGGSITSDAKTRRVKVGAIWTVDTLSINSLWIKKPVALCAATWGGASKRCAVLSWECACSGPLQTSAWLQFILLMDASCCNSTNTLIHFPGVNEWFFWFITLVTRFRHMQLWIPFDHLFFFITNN